MTPDTICQIPETHSQLPHILHAVSQWVKYAGIGLSALFSIYSLRQETWDKHKKNFTPHGARLAALLVLSGTLALSGAIVEDKANEKLQDEASKHGNETFKQELCKANRELTMTLATEIRETNRTITKNLEPRFNNIIKQQQKGTQRAVEQINDATTTLQTSLGEVIPLNELKTTVYLKDFVVRQVAYESIPAKDRSQWVDRPAEEQEFAALVCNETGQQHPWELEIPVTTGIHIVAGLTEHSGKLKDTCAFPAYAKLLNFDNTRTLPAQTCVSSSKEVLIGWGKKRADLPLELAWLLNRHALEIYPDNKPPEKLRLLVKVEVGAKITVVPKTIIVNTTASYTGHDPEYTSRTYQLSDGYNLSDEAQLRVDIQNGISPFLYITDNLPRKGPNLELILLAELQCQRAASRREQGSGR